LDYYASLDSLPYHAGDYQWVPKQKTI
jgi:hypothetical protein